jgi:hypothetical protein
MDNPTTLLVAIMYVTILSTGLINLLLALSEIVGKSRRLDPVHTGWIVLLLLVYLNFFWETTAILEIEGWMFLTFIAFITGPIFLLFSTQLILVAPPAEKTADLTRFFLDHCGSFFLLLGLVQAWVVGLDFMFSTVGSATYLTAGIAILFGFLMTSRNYRVHTASLLVIGLAFVGRTVLQIF